MVSLKHKVTIRTKTAQEETPAAVGRPGVTLKRKQPEVADKPVTEPKPEPAKIPQTPKPEKKSNTGKVVGGIAAAAALFAGVYFFGMKGEDKVVDDGGTPPTEQVAKAGEVNQPEASSQTGVPKGDAASEGENVNNDSQGASSSVANGASASAGNENVSVPSRSEDKQSDSPSATSSAPVQQVKSNQGIASSTKIAAASEPLGEDLVENAKRVIRGDFGNGQERKNRLGPAYAEIQSKVNEMYRQGRVY
jgi:hypothetical protein